MFRLNEIESLIFLLIYAVPLGLLLWALIDALKTSRLTDTQRLTWIIVIIFVPCIGPILYFVIGGSGKRPDPRDYMPDEAPAPRDDL